MTDITVAFVNVGQGDCVVAVDRTSGEALLVDCPEGRHNEALEALRACGARRVSVAVVTHQHLDHLGGVLSTITAFPTACVRMNDATHLPADPDERKKLRSALLSMAGLPRRGIAIDFATVGDQGTVGKLSWEVLSPDRSQLFSAQAANNPNHASVVLRLTVGEHRILLGSDADAESWSKIIGRGEITADVFQLPHHGASMTEADGPLGLGDLLDATHAAYYLVSVGSQNNYGHPANSTLTEIRARRGRAQTYCTQLNAICAGRAPGKEVACAGTVTLTFKGDTMTVTPTVSDHAAAVRRLPCAQCA